MKFSIPLAAGLLQLCAATGAAQFFNDFDQPPHDYWTVPMHDPMTELLRRVEKGGTRLDDAPGLPLVKRLLKELDIPEESQVLVFSKTSLQRGAVTPSNPRAIYFNEEAYVAWMPGGRIEIASSDPERGAVFYFQRKLDQSKGKLFTRDRVCIQCHAGSATNFLPGLLGRSVYPDARGRSLKSVDSFERVGHNVPIGDRWGGWYVTGSHAGLHHMGNSIAARAAGGVDIDREKNAALSGLGAFFDEGKYPHKGSDIVALLVLDHQVSMHFKLMEAHYVVRQIIADAKWKDGQLPDELPEEFALELDGAAERVVSHLLFQHEAPLGDDKIVGSGAFQKVFLASRKTDSDGRSLKDLRLQGRLFEHRCSFMIHSKSFVGMPEILKKTVLKKIRAVLSAEKAPDGYEHLPEAERKAILQILTATVPGFEN